MRTKTKSGVIINLSVNFVVFKKQMEVPKYSRMGSIDEIENNDYNLNIFRYIDSFL